VLVEREVRDQALQPRILVLELADPPDLVDAEMPVALLPDVERLSLIPSCRQTSPAPTLTFEVTPGSDHGIPHTSWLVVDISVSMRCCWEH
jgi:hypothetical protein